MVNAWLSYCLTALLAAESPLATAQGLWAIEQTEPLLQRLPPERRAMVIMALLGLVLVGIALIMFAWLGGRYFRRLTAKPLPPASQTLGEPWYHKPLNADSSAPDDQDVPPGS